MRLIPQHQRLLLCVGGVSLGLLLVGLLVVRPLATAVRGQERRVEDLRRQLRDAGIQVDLTRLRQRLAQAQEDHRKLSATAELVTARARGMFDERIRTQYGSLADFRTQVSRLDYQEEYSRIQRELGQRGVRLGEGVLNLSENTVSPATWQLVMQLWTVESLVQIALESHLSLVTVEVPRKVDSERGTVPAMDAPAATPEPPPVNRVARITVLPVREYLLPQEGGVPYLLEIPVRITVTGRLQDLCLFLKAVVEPPTRAPRGGHPAAFLPVSHFEIRKPVPAAVEDDESRVEAILECCGFFPLGDRNVATAAAPPLSEPAAK
jgi:hypothetical protein